MLARGDTDFRHLPKVEHRVDFVCGNGAGLLDEIHINLAPVLLGTGVRLFDHLGVAPVDLERTRVVEAPGVTHLRFRVVR